MIREMVSITVLLAGLTLWTLCATPAVWFGSMVSRALDRWRE